MQATSESSQISAQLTALDQRLAAMDRKLDYVVERQRFIEDMIDEMTPVGREALGSIAAWMGDLEARGYFAVGKELMAMTDRVVAAYGVEEVARLSEHIVLLLDTVRNLSQPDLLQVANEAADVVHHADEVKPIGLFGMARASGDTEVQRGMAVALQILRHLGRAQGAAASPTVRPPHTHSPPPQRTAMGNAAQPAPAAAPPPEQVVMWAGRRFSPEGYLIDTADWDEELATQMAQQLGVELNDVAWTILRWAREDYLTTGASPNVRRVANGSGVGTRAVYEAFPKSPGKTTAMLAGIPKPVGCV